MKPTSERINERYSDERAEAVPWTDAEVSLAAAEIAVPDVQVVVFEVRPDKAYGHAKCDPFSRTDYRLWTQGDDNAQERAS